MAKTCTVTSIRGEQVSTIAQWMRNHFDNARDDRGVVSLTALGEAAADSYDLYEDNGDIPEELFELAYDVARSAGELGD